MNNLQPFPTELFAHVAENLNAHDLAALSSASKPLYIIANNDRLWRNLFPAFKLPETNCKQFLNDHSAYSLVDVALKIADFSTTLPSGELHFVEVIFPFNNGCYFDASLMVRKKYSMHQESHEKKELRIFVKKQPQIENEVDRVIYRFDDQHWEEPALQISALHRCSNKIVEVLGRFPHSISHGASAHKHFGEFILNLLKERADVLKSNISHK